MYYNKCKINIFYNMEELSKQLSIQLNETITINGTSD